ncbi:MAG: PD-(D/E)XK nuclease family protein [Armatimonadetes bacterium]|nr:PD-(D/E)XK nuclease family protein [Armatimonadota bacterium]
MPAQWIVHLTTRSGLEGGLVETYRAEAARLGSDGVALLTPTQAAAEIARRLVVSGSNAGALLDPRIMTFPQLADALLVANHTSSRQLTATQRELLVADVLAELAQEPELEYLRATHTCKGTIGAICNLLDELKRGGVSSDDLPELVSKAVPGHPANQAVSLVFARYQDRLQELALYDEPGLFWNALDLLENGKRRPLEDLRVLLLDGFQEFTTTQTRMLEELGNWLERIELRLWLDPCREQMTPRAAATRNWLADAMHAEMRPDTLSEPEPATDLDHLRARVFSLDPAGLAQADGTVKVLEVAGGTVGECREIARRIKLQLAENPDLPPNRIAIVLRSWDTGYDTALHQALEWYGVPADFARGPRLSSVPAVQAALDILDVVVGRWRRQDVIKLLNNGYVSPKDSKYGKVRAQRLERLAMEAGIVGGGDDDTPARQWKAALNRLGHRLGEERRRRRALEDALGIVPESEDQLRVLEDEDGDRLRTLGALDAALEQVERAVNLVDALDDLLRPLATAKSLSGASLAFGEIIKALGIIDSAEKGDASRVALDLQGLDGLSTILREITEAPEVLRITGEVGVAQFAACIRDACGSARLPGNRHRRCGVQVLEASQAALERFDTVFVPGLRDGLFPARPRQDVFYGDAERERLQQDLPGLRPRLGDRHDDEHLLYAALAAAEGEVWLSYPLSEANGAPVLRSSYVDEVLRHWKLAGDSELAARIITTRRQSEVIAGPDEVANYPELLEAIQRPHAGASLQGLINFAENIVPPDELPALAQVRRLALVEALRSQGDGPFCGVLKDQAILTELDERYGPEHTYSVSQLNTYAGCPMRFFLERVLGLEAPTEPMEAIDRRDLGLVAHRILARFFGPRTIGNDDCKPITAENLCTAKAALSQCVAAVGSELDSLARGAAQVWARAMERLEEDLLALLEFEAERNAGEQGRRRTWSPPRQVRAVEAVFGKNGEFVVTPPDCEPVKLRGRIDRVDLTEYEGRRYWVIWDYKTGTGVSANLVRAGADLQLPVYALAVRQLYPNETDDCHLWGYYRVTRPVGWTSVVMGKAGEETARMLDEIVEEAKRKIAQYVADIRAGRFAPVPNESLRPCRYCDFRSICRAGSLIGTSSTPGREQ